MPTNQLKTFTLTGGEDLVTPALEIPDGVARVAFNYEQNYNTGFTRIAGYRNLVNIATPGEGAILGTVVYNDDIYIFRNQVGGLTAGMWKATPAVYDDTVSPATVTSNGSWTEITNIVDNGDIATTLLPDGYFEFVIHNFKATVDRARYRGNYESGIDYLIADIVTDAAGDLGTIGLNYECDVNHKAGPTMTAANWTLITATTTAPGSAHDISGSSGNLYGVDGKNPSFEFNGTQLKQIDSTFTPDIPMHIEANGNRLVIGFRAGEIALSQLGEPFGFDPVYGAGSIGVTDFLTGLVAGPDGVLYIYAKDKIYLLYGTGGPLDQAELKKHSRDVGAYPYTMHMLAGHAMFYDTWGISEVKASDVFGDVITSSLSRKIQKVLSGQQAWTSVVLKEKAQYRLYFKQNIGGVDKTVCVLSTIMEDENVGFTHATYEFNISVSASGEIGTEEFSLIGTEDGKVYHMDKGTNFDGDEYNSYFTLPFNYLGSPHRVKKIRKIMMNIEASDNVAISGSVDFSFGQSNHPKDSGSDIVEPSGARWGEGVWGDFSWGGGFSDYVEAYINGHGDNVAVTISSTSALDEPHTLKDITYIYQHQRIPH